MTHACGAATSRACAATSAARRATCRTLQPARRRRRWLRRTASLADATRAELHRCADTLAGGARGAALALALATSLAAPLQACAALDADTQARNDVALSGGERAFRPLTAAEARAKRGLFTDDAYDGMLALSAYAEYVESLRAVEAAPDCEACATERQRLERAWQTVANEAYSGDGAAFTQARWARTLEPALRRAGGALRTPADTAAAVRSIVAELADPYSAYLAPPEWRAALGRPLPAERDYAAALAVGVGLQLGAPLAGRGVLLSAPLAGSAAEEAGVAPGDVLLAVDGAAVSDLGVDDVRALLRGPDGSAVTLTLARGFRGGSKAVTLTRRPLPLPALAPPELLALPGDSGGGALLIRLRYFSSEGTAALSQALRFGEAARVSAYIVDVRNNPGGVLEEAIASAALFSPCGARVAQTHRGGAGADVRYVACALPPGQFVHPPTAPLTRAPLVVIMNGGSASAAEAFAAGVRDAAGARLVGTRSFGKSQVQFFWKLGDGGGLRLTALHWRTPRRGDDVARAPRGLAPDLMCSDHPRARGEPPDACIRMALNALAPLPRAQARRT